jgi:hypothetical protein
MDSVKVSSWLMIAAGCACIVVGCVIALRRPNQWKALLVLLSFSLVCLGVLPASQWLAALPGFKSDRGISFHNPEASDGHNRETRSSESNTAQKLVAADTETTVKRQDYNDIVR